MVIVKANTNDAIALTELALRSKAFWGYEPRQIELWRSELSISEDYILRHKVFKLLNGEELYEELHEELHTQQHPGLHGFYAFRAEKECIHLDFLFIEPRSIGQGFGSLLLDDFLHRATKGGFKSVVLEADPNAERFYLKKGFETTGHRESSIRGRFLPIMKFNLGTIR